MSVVGRGHFHIMATSRFLVDLLHNLLDFVGRVPQGADRSINFWIPVDRGIAHLKDVLPKQVPVDSFGVQDGNQYLFLFSFWYLFSNGFEIGCHELYTLVVLQLFTVEYISPVFHAFSYYVKIERGSCWKFYCVAVVSVLLLLSFFLAVLVVG